MKFLIYTLVFLLPLSGCSLGPFGEMRSPASVGDGHHGLEAALMQKDTIQETYSQIILQYAVAYSELEQFDSHLENHGGELFDNPHYAGLLASRAVIEEKTHRIEDYINFHIEQVFNQENSLDGRRESLEKLKWIFPPDHSEFAVLYESVLGENFTDLTERLLLSINRLRKDELTEELEEYYKNYQARFSIFKSTKKINPPHEFKLRFEAIKKSKLWHEVQKNHAILTQEFKHHMKEFKLEKNTSLERFFPTTQRAGNIVGTEFPAKVWSLTFDDGPVARNTNRVLANLKKHNLKATFFQLSRNAQSFRTVTKNLLDNGMEIASHSYTHPQITKISSEARNREIKVAAEVLGDLVQKPIQFYRLPYGAGVSNSDIRQRIADSSMIHVFWNIDTLDWMNQPPAEIVARTIKQMKATSRDAGVILFHDIHDRTVIASEEIMNFLLKDERQVCLLEEIVENMNRGLPACSGK
jgi:peptidoglycan/xylan/chitin deacetylase (PgdA/CDA1 family)